MAATSISLAREISSRRNASRASRGNDCEIRHAAEETIAKFVTQRSVVGFGKPQELLQLAAVIRPLLLQQGVELLGREQSRAPQAVAGGGPTDTKVVSQPDHIVELYLLGSACGARPRMGERTFIEHAGVHPARPALAGGVNELTHGVGRHQEACREGVGTDLTELVSVLPMADQAALVAVHQNVTVLVRVRESTAYDMNPSRDSGSLRRGIRSQAR